MENRKMLKQLFFLFSILYTIILKCNCIEQASVGELFTYKIEPMLFNWTHQVMSEQFRYRVSLASYPDLPSWMRYMYSHEYHAGFLYGTPPERLAGKSIHFDIIALNKQNYETRQKQLSIYVSEKFPTPNIIQMKIDNLNWVHLMDPGRVENLRNIFRKDLWPASENDLTLIFLESAVNMGGRLPLRPQQHEGVIVHLGSFAQFSPRLKELQEEVRPLYKLPTCTYKRTSVQKIFENAGFKLDWCAFKMVGADISPEILFHNHGRYSGSQHTESSTLIRNDRWHSLERSEVPKRNYIDEFAFAFAIPGMIFAILLGMLSAILCFQHEKLFDPQSDFFFEHVFYLCESREEDLSYIHKPVHMVHAADVNGAAKFTTTTKLKGLKDPNSYMDNTSLRSNSPNESLQQAESPSDNTRPKPPPYKCGSLARNGVDI